MNKRSGEGDGGDKKRGWRKKKVSDTGGRFRSYVLCGVIR